MVSQDMAEKTIWYKSIRKNTAQKCEDAFHSLNQQMRQHSCEYVSQTETHKSNSMYVQQHMAPQLSKTENLSQAHVRKNVSANIKVHAWVHFKVHVHISCAGYVSNQI